MIAKCFDCGGDVYTAPRPGDDLHLVWQDCETCKENEMYAYREEQPVKVYHERKWHHATTYCLSGLFPEQWWCELEDGTRLSVSVDHMKARERRSR